MRIVGRGAREGKTMAVLRSKRCTGTSSSSNSKSFRSADVSDDASKSLRARIVATRPKPITNPKPRKVRKRNPDELRPYAQDAINAYNERTGTKYELVQPGYIKTVDIGTCFLHHMDFTAKKLDVADAPEEMFFAELTTDNDKRCVKFCKCMGPKESISGDKNNGCCYCMHHIVQHPRGGGFMAGRAGLFTDE